MANVPDIYELLRDNSVSFTKEELEKIIETELSKPEKEQNSELINLCRTLSDTEDTATTKSKRKLSFRLISLIITIAIFIFALVPVFLKGLNVNLTGPDTHETTSDVSFSENISSTTQLQTDIAEASSTTIPDVLINFLNKPEKIIFYHNGNPQTIAKDNAMCDDVIKSINNVTQNNEWEILKLAVEESYINKTKSENLCIEIHYDAIQYLNNLSGIKGMTYSFDKVLLVLDGDDKGTMFFCENENYRNGPIKSFSSSLSEDVLSNIFD